MVTRHVCGIFRYILSGSDLRFHLFFKEYHCGSPAKGWSGIFFFNSMPLDTDWSPRFAIFGDMGNTNAQSLTRLQEETMLGYYDAIFHIGDFAYDMHDV